MPATDPSASRLDKWLWCVRVFKTRSLATDACRAGTVTVNDQPAKPARDLRVGETVCWRHGLVLRSFRVLGLPPRRLPGRDVPAFCEETTSAEEWAKAERSRVEQFLARERGTGRPTKRDRRRMDQLFRS